MAERAGRGALKALRNPGRIVVAAAIGIFVVLIVGQWASVFYTDVLWFDAAGYGGVFWKRLSASVVVRLITGAVGCAIILANLWYVLRQLGPVHLRRRYGNLEIAEQVPRRHLIAGAVVVAVLAGWWLSAIQFGGSAALAMLAWLSAVPWGVADPLFGHDISFYVFALPAWIRILDFLLIVLVWSLLLIGIGYVLVGAIRVQAKRWDIDERPRLHFAVLLAAVLVVFGVRYILGRYELLFDGGGFGGTIGYADVHARLPARLVIGILSAVAGVSLVVGTVRRSWVPPVISFALLLLVGFLMNVAYPTFVQKIQVEPNQLGREVDYIRWNMAFTRRAYGLDAVERRAFAYRDADAATWERYAPALAELPLWDLPPLATLFNEVEGRIGYYEFHDVDYDRYGTPGDRRQVVAGVREFNEEELNPNSRTWQTLHLNPIATRGMGIVVAPAAAKRPNGDPVYWLSELHPVKRHESAPEALALSQPSVFFGETMSRYAVVGHNVRFTDSADGVVMGALPPAQEVTTGVTLSSYLRVLAFAWRFGDENLLFARELGDTSRLIFRRTVGERLAEIAPFLLWDGDPQPVVLDGRVVWIVDGYTATANFPLARSADIGTGASVRYLRGSVKATVDAVTGEVAIYALPDPDPILRTYSALFPGLIRDAAAMPAGVAEHLRYPALLFALQSEILQQYHVDQPQLFYGGQDVWSLPDDLTPDQQQRFRPAYMMARMPGGAETEFLLMNSFIALERQNLTALLIARSDAPHYGELVLVDMPRDDQIKGPAQVQSIIEQDPVLSQQLSLWRQRGSNVELGRLRIVPTDSSLLYVEPLFLSAQQGRLPQLQRVIVTNGTNVAMAENLAAAIAALTGNAPAIVRDDRAPQADAPASAVPLPGDDLNQRALELMREAERRLRAGDFAGFGEAWERLRILLEQPRDPPPAR